jgi:hypothetical protein
MKQVGNIWKAVNGYYREVFKQSFRIYQLSGEILFYLILVFSKILILK